MDLILYNTLSRKKEIFSPIKAGEVKMYCCGPTVYDFLHVGNFRGAVFYNFLRNHLEVLKYKVTFIYNFTDVDDKILNKAKLENTNSKIISERYIEEFKKDFLSLDLRPHEQNPKVTEYMSEIINMISDLIKKNIAYEVNGEVFYSVKSFSGYGKLSGRNVEELQSGSRIEIDPKKRDAMDFSLWKPAKEGEDSWDSPWGKGRPGWHIECSAMNLAIHGEQIDIHGGGMDLIFPHHENEIAQSEGCTGKHFAKYWLHNNMFTFGGTKMSKSLGNVRTMRGFLEEFNGEIFKSLVLSVHYRSECEFTEKTINSTISILSKFYSALRHAQDNQDEKYKDLKDAKVIEFTDSIKTARQKILAATNDDFNTPEIMAELFNVLRLFNQWIKPGQKITEQLKSVCYHYNEFMLSVGQPMALFQKPARAFLSSLDQILIRQKGIDVEKIKLIVEARTEARKNKDFATSDKLRDELLSMGIQILDTPTGTVWEIDRG